MGFPRDLERTHVFNFVDLLVAAIPSSYDHKPVTRLYWPSSSRQLLQSLLHLRLFSDSHLYRHLYRCAVEILRLTNSMGKH